MIPTTIVDPEKIAWEGNAQQVVLALQDGLVGILPGHADAIFALAPSIIRIKTASPTEIKFFVAGGVAKVIDKKLTVIADTVESPDKIDRDRAEKARQRALERLQGKPGSVNLDRARLALAKAILRLQMIDA